MRILLLSHCMLLLLNDKIVVVWKIHLLHIIIRCQRYAIDYLLFSFVIIFA